MTEAPRYATFRDYLRVAREWRVLVIAVTLLFGGVALVYSLQQTRVYQAEAALEFQDINTDISAFGQSVDNGGQTPDARAAASASTLIRPAVTQRAMALLGRQDGLGGSVTARPEARTNLVIVQASAGEPEDAARIANAVARAAISVTEDDVRNTFRQDAQAQRRVLRRLADRRKAESTASFQELQLRESIASLEELSRVADPVVLRDTPVVPTSPVSPKPVRTTLLGLLIGLTLGLIAAFVRDSLDRRFRTAHEVTEELHLPLVGFVPEAVLGHSIAPGSTQPAMSPEQLEGFRVLRTNVEFLDVDNTPKVLLVTSALPEEGKSTVSAGLAAAYAVAGKHTLLVESDLRRPSLARRTDLEPGPGLSDYLVGHADPQEVLQQIAPLIASPENGDRPSDSAASAPVVAIAAGSQTPQPAELLRSKRCQEFFAEVRGVYDVVIIDTCPLLSVVDTLELLPLADAVVLCVRASKTTRDQAQAAKSALAHFPDRPTGVVLTGVRATDEASYYGYYSYGYVYGAA